MAAVVFGRLVGPLLPARSARIASAWFALGVGVELLSGRVPFDIGLALALGSLLACAHRRRISALALALATSAASPVAGLFLAMAVFAWALIVPGAGRSALHLRRIYASSSSRFIESLPRPGTPVGRTFRLSLAAAALLVILALSVMFPEGGSEPFAASSFWPALALTLLLAVCLPGEQRLLRTGALLYAALLLAAFLAPTPVGGNAARLGALAAGPLAACALAAARPRLLLALTPALLYWQMVTPITDLVSATSDPAVNASYYRPLLSELGARGALQRKHPTRIEVVPSRDHWEVRWMAPSVALARGWERQLDSADNGLFYSSRPLTPDGYRAWLEREAISYVALPDSPLDTSARAEGRLVGSETPAYLREVWRSAHWRLFAVANAQPLAQTPATLTRMSSDSFTVDVPRPGAFVVRVHFSPYWALQSGAGCVARAAGGWTQILPSKAGQIVVGADFSLGRIFNHGPRCR